MNDEIVEQADPETDETSLHPDSASDDSISDILGNALKGKADNPDEAVEPTEEEKPVEQTPQKEAETLFGEIMLDEAKKIGFKTEEDFHKFLDRNPLLRDGFLRHADYTRKTTQVSEDKKKYLEEKKQFDELKVKDSETWGASKPTDDDMGFFKNLWHVFQYGSEPLANQISAFARDVSLIAQGRVPVGPLAGTNGQPVDFQHDSQVISVRREFDQYRQEQERKEKERTMRDEALENEKATAEVDSWISAQLEKGVKLSGDELRMMSLFSNVRDENNKRISLDEMYRLALTRLGRTEKTAINKVFKGAKESSARTPSKPASKVPSSSQPEPSTVEDILKQGLEKIKAER